MEREKRARVMDKYEICVGYIVKEKFYDSIIKGKFLGIAPVFYPKKGRYSIYIPSNLASGINNFRIIDLPKNSLIKKVSNNQRCSPNVLSKLLVVF